jgi:hypothetical protein
MSQDRECYVVFADGYDAAIGETTKVFYKKDEAMKYAFELKDSLEKMGYFQWAFVDFAKDSEGIFSMKRTEERYTVVRWCDAKLCL